MFIVHDFVGAWNGELIDDAVYFSTLAHDLIDLFRVNAKVLELAQQRRAQQMGSLLNRERVMNCFGDLRRVTHA